jgi:hypothetical protein
MRYFIEGETAHKYRDYFLKLFRDGSEEGTLILDLVTHPLTMPDFRIKVYSTTPEHSPPQFLPAIEFSGAPGAIRLKDSGAVFTASPGYYSLEFTPAVASPFSVTVKNLKLQEVILHKHESGSSPRTENVLRFPFAIFPVRENSRFTLFSQKTLPELTAEQPIRFEWSKIPSGLQLKQIESPIEVTKVEFSPADSYDHKKPYLEFRKNESFHLKCSLQNRAATRVSGYVEGILSEIGEPQPWKNFEVASEMQEFFLESGQSITIDIPMNTETLTGDHQLSYWIFTRHDLPYSPQNGGWFNKQIRVIDPKLGIHPVYDIPIP